MSTDLWTLLLAGVVAAALAGGPGSGWAAQIHVGAAETSITPDRPVALEGQFRLRISKGVDSPIMASVVVLESREGDKVLERSVMVSADLVHFPTELLQLVRDAATRKVPGLEARKLFVNVTHTHTAPVVEVGNFTLPEGVMTVEEYCAFFAERVSQAVADACKSLQPASVAWGLGYAQVAYNRRTAFLDGKAQMYGQTAQANYKGPEGPEYGGIPALFFLGEAGKPIAVAANVWCPSQEVEGNSRISADFWHSVRGRLKAKLGPQTVVLAWCGPAGDQSPHRRMQQDAEERMRKLRGVESWVDELGRRIATCVLETYELVKDDRHAALPHVHQVETIRLPGWKLSEGELAHLRAVHDRMADDLRQHPEKAATLSRPVSWRAQTLERQEELSKSPDGCYATEIHVLRIGDVAVCTNQFELFTEYGLRILARSKAHLTFVVQLAGPAYYLPTEEAVRGGGYSAIPESCAVGPEGGNALVEKTIAKLHAMWE